MNGSCLVVSTVHSGGSRSSSSYSTAAVPSIPVGVGGATCLESMSKNGNPWLALVAKLQSLAGGI
jgi:hypothetical protein